jgi:hypothetical protein
MGKAVSSLFIGIFILILALFIWRITENFWGWLALFLPGAFYVFWGIRLITREWGP